MGIASHTQAGILEPMPAPAPFLRQADRARRCPLIRVHPRVFTDH